MRVRLAITLIKVPTLVLAFKL